MLLNATEVMLGRLGVVVKGNESLIYMPVAHMESTVQMTFFIFPQYDCRQADFISSGT